MDQLNQWVSRMRHGGAPSRIITMMGMQNREIHHPNNHPTPTNRQTHTHTHTRLWEGEALGSDFISAVSDVL